MIIKKEFDLTECNSYRIKAICKTAFFPDNEHEIWQLYNNHAHQNIIVLGNGNNIILSKHYYDNPFIIFQNNYNNVIVEDHTLIAEAGATLLEISEIALKNRLSGAEIFYDIPSSIGGAVVMNAGASGEEISDILVKVRFLDLKDMSIKEISKEKILYEYRNSIFQKTKDKIILKAWLKLEPGSEKRIGMKMLGMKSQRWKKQPREFPNAGSVFKRPRGYYVGQMIEELGLKGTTFGGAKVSRKHAGFIVNTGDATGNDILTLIRFIKEKVKEHYGVNLEIEQRII